MTVLRNINQQVVAMTAFEAVFAKYIWIWIGLTFGLAAKYALLIKRGVRIRMQLVLADILLLPLVALIAFSIVHRLGADGETAALLTALSTVGADRLIKLLSERFVRQIESELDAMADHIRRPPDIDSTITGRTPADHAAPRRAVEDI